VLAAERAVELDGATIVTGAEDVAAGRAVDAAGVAEPIDLRGSSGTAAGSTLSRR